MVILRDVTEAVCDRQQNQQQSQMLDQVSDAVSVVDTQGWDGGISIYKQDHVQISAVILDMMMPGIDGLQTLDRLKQIDPDVRVIACSGLKTAQRDVEVRQAGAKAFLPKPYSDQQLLDTLSEILNSPA